MVFAPTASRFRGLSTIPVILAFLVPGFAGAVESLPREQVLVVGRVSSDPKNAVPRIEGLVSYLAAQLGSFGIRKGEALVAWDNDQMIRYLREGRVDLVSETPLSAVRFEKDAGAEIFLREWKKGVSQYHTVFFVRRDSSIRSIADLKGRLMAFEDAGSTSAFLMPLAVLHRAGLETVELSGPGSSVPAGQVGYAFANTEVNIPMWVIRGLADAGVLSNLDWDDLDRNPSSAHKELRVFYQTPPFLRSTMLVRAGLSRDLKEGIAKVLLGMHETAEGEAALNTYYKVSKYDRIEGEVSESLQQARDDYAFVERWVK